MRGMIIGFSTLAIAALPTMAIADGDGADHPRCRRCSRGCRCRRPGWRGRLAVSQAASLAEPLRYLDPGRAVVAPGPVPAGPCSTRSTTRSDDAGNSVTHQTTNCPD